MSLAVRDARPGGATRRGGRRAGCAASPGSAPETRRAAGRAATVCLFACAACAQPDTPGVPVEDEPRHRLVSETERANVLDIQILGGDTTLAHVHARPIAYACVSGSTLEVQEVGTEAEWTSSGEPCTSGAGWTATSYAAEPLTHRVANAGLDAFRVIGVQNLGTGASDEWFELRTVTLGYEAEDALHRHDDPTLVVLATGAIVNRLAGGRETLLLDPGTWVWVEAGASHSMLNEERAEARVVEIVVR